MSTFCFFTGTHIDNIPSQWKNNNLGICLCGVVKSLSGENSKWWKLKLVLHFTNTPLQIRKLFSLRCEGIIKNLPVWPSRILMSSKVISKKVIFLFLLSYCDVFISSPLRVFWTLPYEHLLILKWPTFALRPHAVLVYVCFQTFALDRIQKQIETYGLFS